MGESEVITACSHVGLLILRFESEAYYSWMFTCSIKAKSSALDATPVACSLHSDLCMEAFLSDC